MHLFYDSVVEIYYKRLSIDLCSWTFNVGVYLSIPGLTLIALDWQDRAIPIPICETDASEPLDDALVSLDVEVFHDPESQLLLKLWRGEPDIEEMLTQRVSANLC